MPGWVSVISNIGKVLDITDELTQIAYAVKNNFKTANHRDNATQIAEGMTQGFKVSTYVLEMPKTYEYFKKWGKWHFVYAINRALFDIVCMQIIAKVVWENPATWAGWFLNLVLKVFLNLLVFTTSFILISIRWTIFQAIYSGLIGGQAYEELPRRNIVEYKGAWLDKTLFAGLQSSLHYLSDYHSLNLAGALVSLFIPGVKPLVYAITDGRCLVEYSIVANSKDGVPFLTRRKILRDSLLYALGLGLALYFAYLLLSLSFEKYTGISNPLLDASLYLLVYFVFIPQAYQIHELPNSQKRYDIFAKQQTKMDFLLQNASHQFIAFFDENNESKRLAVFNRAKAIWEWPSVKNLVWLMTGFENIKQYAAREEIGDWLLANEYGINLFFVIVLAIQEAYSNSMIDVIEYVVLLASYYSVKLKIAVPYHIDKIIKECLESPLSPIAKKYLADRDSSPITEESFNAFKLLMMEIKSNRKTSREVKSVTEKPFGPGRISVIDGYDESDQVTHRKEQMEGYQRQLRVLEEMEKKKKAVVIQVVVPAPIPTFVPTPSPQASNGSGNVRHNLGLFVIDNYDASKPTQTASLPPGLQRRPGKGQESH